MPRKIKQRANKHRKGTGRLEFLGLRLAESATKLGELKKNQLPGQATQFMNDTMMVSNDSKSAVVNARIKIEARYDEDSTREPAISILASFVAHYSIVEAFTEKQEFETALHRIAMLNIWPYWREFVQSMTTRMGLPAFPVPLVYMDDMVKRDKSS